MVVKFQDLVLLLLQHNANLNIINGEGKIPREMADCTKMNQVTRDSSGVRIVELLLGAEMTECRLKEEKLISSARNGDLTSLSNLVCILL